MSDDLAALRIEVAKRGDTNTRLKQENERLTAQLARQKWMAASSSCPSEIATLRAEVARLTEEVAWLRRCIAAISPEGAR